MRERLLLLVSFGSAAVFAYKGLHLDPSAPVTDALTLATAGALATWCYLVAAQQR